MAGGMRARGHIIYTVREEADPGDNDHTVYCMVGNFCGCN